MQGTSRGNFGYILGVVETILKECIEIKLADGSQMPLTFGWQNNWIFIFLFSRFCYLCVCDRVCGYWKSHCSKCSATTLSV